MSVVATLMIMLICLAAEAFFSGSEIAVVSADRIKLRHEAANGSRGAALALFMLEKPEWLLSTTLVGTNIAIVTNTTVATALVIDLLGPQYGWAAIILVAPLIWVFGEIVSKSIFQQHADAITPVAIYVIRFAAYAFYPILAAFAFLTRFLVKLTGGEQSSNPFTLREEIATMIEMSSVEGDIDDEEQSMIRRVFAFHDTTVEDAQVPLFEVTGIEAGSTCGEAIRLAVERAHRRLVVYEERIDRIVGVVNTLDLMVADDDEPLQSYTTPVRFVPTSLRVEELLKTFRQEGEQLAVVVDEYGGAEGIVTIEDIIEEVVGEIEDEYDDPSAARRWVRKLAKRDYLVNARIELDKLREELGIELPDGAYETLAGYLVNALANIPTRGQVVTFGKYSFTIEQATDRAIQEVRVRW